MEVIGHRGCAAQYPENTVRAARAAARHLPHVEVDVRRCGSGELVVFHDETVDRVTDGTGRVADHTLAELRQLTVLGSGERIPTLAELLAALPPDTGLQVEVKERGLAGDLVGRLPTDRPVAVSSFRPDALAAVRDRDPSIATGLLFDGDGRANLARAADLGCAAVHPHYDLCIETDLVAAAHDRGLDVIAWKAARTSAEVAALRRAGVDGVTADRHDIV